MIANIRSALAIGVGLLSSATAFAGYNDPITFGQAGTVTITLDLAGGGYDHVLELADVMGAIGASPVFYLADGSPGATVLGQAAALVGSSASLGSFGAGQELVFRLTNVESPRLGTPGTLVGQVFTGSASALNTAPGKLYTLVEVLSPTSVHVTVEDLFPFDAPPSSADEFKGGADVSFTLTLTSPVPEAQSLAMALAGLGVIAATLARRRKV